ncbi:hypothetical protein Harman_33920 [Haloarcula mannanilytica]|uniref:FAS1 domain-containing protein n=1 Tax=Haloarcula mannanilytica TaxID=2509225 RepID=A0A4C2EP25_9EURY|nr:fasciclin domain-containing protein [Haloarcula mannanilytica]GCF15457.1 hypothetical protein Harman_33920 [Haloarcula mannanilytica]
MKPTRRSILRSIGAGTAVAVGGVGAVSAAPPSEGETIVDIASSDRRFTILVEALGEAGLVGALDGNRQLTVVAPTNEAFRALLHELGVSKTELLHKDNLADILLYHVIPGRRKANSIANVSRLPTLNGENIEVDNVDGAVRLDDRADIVDTNNEASNGFVHAIDGVLLP